VSKLFLMQRLRRLRFGRRILEQRFPSCTLRRRLPIQAQTQLARFPLCYQLRLFPRHRFPIPQLQKTRLMNQLALQLAQLRLMLSHLRLELVRL